MTTYAFLLDIARCIGCQACVAACKTGNELPVAATTIRIVERTSGTFPNLRGWFQNQRCYHCTNAACVAVCPVGALYKEDGITRLDREKCTGCAYCTDACPYGVPHISDERAFKCDGCSQVVKAGGTPWCVTTCPSQALAYGERTTLIDEANERVAALRTRYPHAQVHGDRPESELGMILVLPDSPEALGLPLTPEPSMAIKTWQNVVKPASLGLTSLSVVVTAIAAMIARRNHVRELESLHRRESDQSAAGSSQTPLGSPRSENSEREA